MEEKPPSAGFTQDGWVRAARISVAISALLWLIMAGVLLMADAPSQCPGWHLKTEHETSLWVSLLTLGGTLNLFGCLIAIRWNWIIEDAISRTSKWEGPAAYVLARLLIVNSVAAQWPLFLLLTKCTPLLGPGGYSVFRSNKT